MLDYVSVCPSLYASNITQKGRTPCRLAQSSATGNACLHLRLRSQGPKNDTQAVVAAVLADKLVCHRKRGGCSFRLHSRAYACKGTLTILKPYWETLQPCCTTFSEPCRNLEACAISLSYGFEMGRAGHDCASVPEEQVPRRAVSRQLAGVFLSQNQASHPMSPDVTQYSQEFLIRIMHMVQDGTSLHFYKKNTVGGIVWFTIDTAGQFWEPSSRQNPCNLVRGHTQIICRNKSLDHATKLPSWTQRGSMHAHTHPPHKCSKMSFSLRAPIEFVQPSQAENAEPTCQS